MSARDILCLVALGMIGAGVLIGIAAFLRVCIQQAMRDLDLWGGE